MEPTSGLAELRMFGHTISAMLLREGWTTRVTAFTITVEGGAWLMLRQRRLGVSRWELPGGHVDGSESLEQTAARETLEETAVPVTVGQLLGTCMHEWAERRQRRFVYLFTATPHAGGSPRRPTSEPQILEVAWHDPTRLVPEDVSPFLYPLIDAHRAGWPRTPIQYRLEHRELEDGTVGPVLLGRVQAEIVH